MIDGQFTPESGSVRDCNLFSCFMKVEKVKSFTKVITAVNLIYRVPGVDHPRTNSLMVRLDQKE